jgi:hypothetical protein
MTSSWRRNLAYGVAWQLAWFAAVVPAGRGLPWVGLLAALPVVLIGGWGRWPRAWWVMAVSLAIGVAVDALLGLSGAANFPGGALDGRLSPPWMWLLWVQLGLALDLCLAWLRRRLWLAVLFGVAGAPGAYLGGVAFGAMLAPQGPLILGCAVGVAYGFALPLLMKLTPCSNNS